MSRQVMLLRHAEPVVRSDQPPSLWPLSAAGRRAAAAIADQLPRDRALASSPEVKAIQTLSAAAGIAPDAVRVDERFAEVTRPGEPFDDDHRRRRLHWVIGRLDERHATWETPQEAAARFQTGVDALEGDRVVIASHGMIIASWLCSIGYVAPGEPTGRLWTGLSFPDLLTVQVE